MESTTAGPLDLKTVQQIDSLWGLVSDCAPPAEFIRIACYCVTQMLQYRAKSPCARARVDQCGPERDY